MQTALRSSIRGAVLLVWFAFLSVGSLHAQSTDSAAELERALARARLEQSSGQYAAAAADYARATSVEKKVAELWADRGLMEYLAGQKPQARVSLRKALALNSRLLTPLLFLGKVYESDGKPEAAIPLLKKAHSLAPADPRVLVALGDGYRAAHDPGDASQVYTQAALIDPTMADAWFGLGVSSLSLIQQDGRVLAEKHATNVWTEALYADELFTQGRSVEAVHTYEKAVDAASPIQAADLAKTLRLMIARPLIFGVSPDSATFLSSLLASLSAKSQGVTASDCIEEPRRDSIPDALFRLHVRTICEYWQGDFTRSANSASRLLAAWPEDPEGLYLSIKSNERLAVGAFSQFEQLAPRSAASYDIVGDLYRRRQQPDKALKEYRKALALDPNDPAAHIGTAAAYLSEGNSDGAISAARALLADRPDDARLNLLMAEGLTNQHEYEAAKPYLKRSLSVPPELLPRVHALMGKVDANDGKVGDAIAQLKLALPSDEDGSIHYQLYRLYLRIGDRAAADRAKAGAVALEHLQMKRATIAMEETGQENP
jgi:tetratricopeptide (TPR) repeat protein